MSGNLRRETLSAFKKLHRTCLKTFQGDDYALQVTRQRINDEFKKNKAVANEGSIQEMIKHAKEVEEVIRTTIVQVIEKEPGLYEARITPDVLVDNAPFGQVVDKSQFKDWPKCTDTPKKKNKK